MRRWIYVHDDNTITTTTRYRDSLTRFHWANSQQISNIIGGTVWAQLRLVRLSHKSSLHKEKSPESVMIKITVPDCLTPKPPEDNIKYNCSGSIVISGGYSCDRQPAVIGRKVTTGEHTVLYLWIWSSPAIYGYIWSLLILLDPGTVSFRQNFWRAFPAQTLNLSVMNLSVGGRLSL